MGHHHSCCKILDFIFFSSLTYAAADDVMVSKVSFFNDFNDKLQLAASAQYAW